MKKIKLFLAVMMLLCITGCGNSSKTTTTVTEAKEEKITLYKYLYFNGYKFRLGGSLDLFVSQTHVKLDKKQFAAAKKNSHKMAGLYYEVEATLEDDKNHCKVTLYIDTSNLDNITIQGISVKSDRGWEDLEPGFLSDPNLVTCGFVFLEGYDIDRDSFSELSPQLKSKAKKRKNKYTEKYDLKLEDDGFGIEIQFDSLKEKSDKIYITNVSVTNNVGLAW